MTTSLDPWGHALSEIDANGMEQPRVRVNASSPGWLIASIGDDESCHAFVRSLGNAGVHGSWLMVRSGEVWLRFGATEHLAALVRMASTIWAEGRGDGMRAVSRLAAG